VAGVSATGTIAFAAAVDGGPSPVIIVRAGRDGLQRVVGRRRRGAAAAAASPRSRCCRRQRRSGGAVSFAVAPTATGREAPEGHVPSPPPPDALLSSCRRAGTRRRRWRR
jgi:hypothetical protein